MGNLETAQTALQADRGADEQPALAADRQWRGASI